MAWGREGTGCRGNNLGLGLKAQGTFKKQQAHWQVGAEPIGSRQLEGDPESLLEPWSGRIYK